MEEKAPRRIILKKDNTDIKHAKVGQDTWQEICLAKS